MDLNVLETVLKQENIGTVVVTIGTTGAGSLDPLPDILELQKKYKFRIHADAAYGGYFILIDELEEKTRSILDHIHEVDSIVVDPHKHGLQPYGCGCVLFKEPHIGKLYKHDSPYTYFSSSDLHLGEISLECSRPGASAVALWATQQYFPLIRGGKFARELQKCRLAAIEFVEKINQSNKFKSIFTPELDIVNFFPWADSCSKISDLSQNLYHNAAKQNLHLALVKYPIHFFKSAGSNFAKDQDEITCLRSCLMKPEHLDWINTIWNILDQNSK
jgi:glutamate/tyrosine decarboxylase-like PLP-dependent enzyme